MKNKILDFLFNGSQVDDELATIVESIADVDVDTDEASVKIEKTPLSKMLKKLGIDPERLELDPEGMVLSFDDGDVYGKAKNILIEPDAMFALTSGGWVAIPCGDNASTAELPHYRIRFIEITTTGADDEEPVLLTHKKSMEKVNDIAKKAQEFAATEMDRDDGVNPIETEPETKKGLGKATDGEDADTSSIKETAMPMTRIPVINTKPRKAKRFLKR